MKLGIELPAEELGQKIIATLKEYGVSAEVVGLLVNGDEGLGVKKGVLSRISALIWVEAIVAERNKK